MKYQYWNGPQDSEPTTITREQILEKYWDYWCSQMRKVGKSGQINEDNCIDDFVCIHWAWRVE